jgi:hypothetical protein
MDAAKGHERSPESLSGAIQSKWLPINTHACARQPNRSPARAIRSSQLEPSCRRRKSSCRRHRAPSRGKPRPDRRNRMGLAVPYPALTNFPFKSSQCYHARTDPFDYRMLPVLAIIVWLSTDQETRCRGSAKQSCHRHGAILLYCPSSCALLRVCDCLCRNGDWVCLFCWSDGGLRCAEGFGDFFRSFPGSGGCDEIDGAGTADPLDLQGADSGEGIPGPHHLRIREIFG